MRVFYVTNLGTRDVTMDGAPAASARADGERWLAEYKTVAAQLDAPILLPGLNHVATLTDRLAGLVLFATDQDETTDEGFRQRDTLFFGRILKRLLPARLPDLIAEGSVQLVRIEGRSRHRGRR